MTAYTVDWSKARKVNYCRTSEIVVLSPKKIRYRFDNGKVSDFVTDDAGKEAAEWIARCRDFGAKVSPA